MNWKIEGLKKFDSIFGRIASSISKFMVTPRREVSDNPSILVIRPGGIGDAVLLYPALDKLREHFPDSRIDILAEKRNEGILKDCRYTDNLYLYDRNPPFELFSVLRGGKYDIVIDTEQWHRLSAVVGYCTRAAVRVGFATNDRADLYTNCVEYSLDDYEAESFLRLAEEATGQDCEFDKDSPFLKLSSVDMGSFVEVIQTIKERSKAVVGIFTGATVKERRWGAYKFALVAAELLAQDIGIVLVGGASEIADVDEFNLGTYDRILNLIGKTSLSQTASIISQLDLMITGDTGILHIAYGVGTPTVSLFGAGIQKKWAPAGNKHAVINKGYSCSPCTKYGYTPDCPYDVKCLGDISVDEVKISALNLLEKIKG